MKTLTLISCLLLSLTTSATLLAKQPIKPFNSQIRTIPPTIQNQMQPYTWREDCPLPLKDLRYLTLSYWGFDNKPHRGALIINKALAKEVMQIFKLLYRHHFPIERMELMQLFKGDDDRAMAANNSSSFNCRRSTTYPSLFSQHSYGRAIDINPLINPYVKGKLVSPSKGRLFVDRSKPYLGKITRTSLIYKLFTQYGWDWGGNWYDVQDYQHFEKRAGGEKRNPYGY